MDRGRSLDELPINSGDFRWALNLIDSRFQSHDPVFDGLDEDVVLLRRARRRRKLKGAAGGLALCLGLSTVAACGGWEAPGLRVQEAILVQLEPQGAAPRLPRPDQDGPPIVALLSLGPDDAAKLLRYPVPAGVDPSELARELSRQPGVAFAEPIFLYQAERVPNDPRLKDLWGLSRIGAPAAWTKSTGDRRVIVAVIDDGVALTHPDLAPNLWVNPRPEDSEVNFVELSADPSPVGQERWHGTHVAGIIGALGDNGRGVAGVNWQVSLMALRALGPDGGRSDALVRAIDYATDHGARVINLSWSGGGGGRSAALEQAIARASDRGVLVVAAAGNAGADEPAFPASLDGVVSVGASGPDDLLAPFSNRGALLTAPGVGILSTTAPGQYERYDGTSMSAAYVSGVAALLWAAQPKASLAQVRTALVQGAVPVEGAQLGRINAAAALAALGLGDGPGPLLLSRSSLEFSTSPGRLPKAQSIWLRASGGGARHWTAKADAPWLHLSQAEGETPARLSVRLDAAGLALGDSIAQVAIDGLDLAVAVHVGNGAVLSVQGPGCALANGQLSVAVGSVCTLSAPGAREGSSSVGTQWRLPGGALVAGASLTAQFIRAGGYPLRYSTDEGVIDQLAVLVE